MALTSTASTHMGLRALKVRRAPALSYAGFYCLKTNLYACTMPNRTGACGLRQILPLVQSTGVPEMCGARL